MIIISIILILAILSPSFQKESSRWESECDSVNGIHGKTSGIRVGGKERRSMPVRDQFIVDGVHEGIITVEEFENAQIAVRRMSSVGYRQDRGELLNKLEAREQRRLVFATNAIQE